MIVPIRCFSCGKVVGNVWDQYSALIQSGYDKGDAMTFCGLKRYCCRRMILTHVDLVEKLLLYNRKLIFSRFSNAFKLTNTMKDQSELLGPASRMPTLFNALSLH
ncbi:DNA-directed RNA polymerase II subunit L, variant 2 [Entomophthora muscae]|uniref:DNA-directed RNA polymerase II subunit L, variant 2 n=1 Tax=Entomophthora muscae TaxID=34485 RepID=A0ACC2SA44_9FUNG|nr:DNA-directed RNA polymerase II subunit L, variant 2 [Entomophthora muscae]